jgi:hypothetical protein
METFTGPLAKAGDPAKNKSPIVRQKANTPIRDLCDFFILTPSFLGSL